MKYTAKAIALCDTALNEKSEKMNEIYNKIAVIESKILLMKKHWPILHGCVCISGNRSRMTI